MTGNAETTEIRFYGCRQPVEALLPKLIETALGRNIRAVVRAPTEERIKALDSKLWTAGDAAFLPHGSAGDGNDPATQPVWLSTGVNVPNGASLLVLVDGAEAPDVHSFDRVCYLYPDGDEGALAGARAFGEAAGGDAALEWVHQTPGGKWEETPPPSGRAKAAPAATAPGAEKAPSPAASAAAENPAKAETAPPAPKAPPPKAAAPTTADAPAGTAEPAPDGRAAAGSGPVERTLSIIKPNATEANVTGRIVAHLEEGGLRVVAQRRIRLTRAQAEAFYAEHRERPFFSGLCDFMTSGPVVVQVLEGPDAIRRNRELMGATNPAEADEGTIRKTFGSSIEANAVHGSDGPESAAREVAFFFAACEVPT